MESKMKTSSAMNGGRWTEQEHESFLVGLHLYGREWKKVASKIKTRTSAQIRSHAQKYFAKLSKDGMIDSPLSDDGSVLSDTDSLKSESKKRTASIPSPEEILSIASPTVRERVSTLIDAEVCALQVLAWYADHSKRLCVEKKPQLMPKSLDMIPVAKPT